MAEASLPLGAQVVLVDKMTVRLRIHAPDRLEALGREERDRRDDEELVVVLVQRTIRDAVLSSRNVSREHLLALYRAADVMLVTPLRDGMNLVAKEYVAARSDEQGVLVLSEFTGAATQLDDALTVNPYDLAMVARSIKIALSMTSEEQRARMTRLRAKVRAGDVDGWVDDFLRDLEEASEAPQEAPCALLCATAQQEDVACRSTG